MCVTPDSRPPIDPLPPMAGGAIDHERRILESADGTRFATFWARADHSGEGSHRPVVLILPDVRGLHPFYEELALRFAEQGLDAVVIDYFGRTAGTDERPADFDYQPHIAEVRWDQVRTDIATTAAAIGADDASRLFTVGFCFGGRLSFLMAADEEVAPDGVVGFYGIPHGPGRAGSPAPVDGADRMSGALLGLFGGADQSIPQEEVKRFDEALDRAGLDHTLHVYPGAPHSFFDRKAADFASESTDAWERTLSFIRSHAEQRARG
jgi:carboxymethylenebutenolidase